MFFKAFEKVAYRAYAVISPEEYYALKGEKDPHVGAEIGAVGGALAAAKKAKKGHKSKAALIGAAAGALAGAAAGHVGGKLVRKYQTHKVRSISTGLNLRSTPKYKEEE